MKIIKLINGNEVQMKNFARTRFAHDIVAGLSKTPKKISSKYFYDERGSQLFQDITMLDEYYLTRKEFEIIEQCSDLLPGLLQSKELDIVELGVGDGHKTKLIIDKFLQKNVKVHFFPIDISAEALNQLEGNLLMLPEMETQAVLAEYLEGLRYVRSRSSRRQMVLFLGSNIGNFDRTEVSAFLKRIKSIMHQDDFLLIGFDLKKDIDILTHAYNDKEGKTAEFNLNVLRRINHELGGNFQLENFRHLGQYNPLLGAMESFLISLKEQTVTLESVAKSFVFEPFEAIHTEYSFKYNERDIAELGQQGGFVKVANFSDQQHYYIDSLWQAH